MEPSSTSSDRIDLESRLIVILKNAIEALVGSSGVIATWSDADHSFVVNVSYGLDSKALERLNPLLREAIPDLAGSHESFNLLSKLQPQSSLPSSDKLITQDPVIALPLHVGNQSIGLIYILRPLNTVAFSSTDQPILAAFAEQAAIAVQNIQLAHLLAEEKQRIESILEGSAEGIMTIDNLCHIVDFNLAMERITGYRRDEVQGKYCASVLNLCDWEGNVLCASKCPMRAHYEDRRSVLEKQGRINTKDGQDVDIAMVYSIISSSEGHPLSAIINVRDISRLKESEDLRATFLSMIGHELQTPLSIIKGFASTLTRSDGKWNEKSIRDGLQVVEEECDHMNKLVERILLASRIEAGALTLRKDSVQLRSLAGKVVRRFQNVTSIHNFKITFAPKFPAVKVDPDLIEEVLSNLVDNAVKYSPEGGEVTISGTVSNNHVEVIVTDEGIGIPLRDLDYIFDRFHRVDTTSVLKIRGVGLGLYLCRYIVEAHGGSISATSELGKGSQLAFTLPLHPTSHDMP